MAANIHKVTYINFDEGKYARASMRKHFYRLSSGLILPLLLPIIHDVVRWQVNAASFSESFLKQSTTYVHKEGISVLQIQW